MTSQSIGRAGYSEPEPSRLAAPFAARTLSDLLRAYRAQRGLSIPAAGRLVGGSHCVWVRWESGVVPSPAYLSRIAELLELTSHEARRAAGPDRVRRPISVGEDDSSALARWRAERQISATELARRLHVSLSLVSRWEAEERTPGRRYWPEIAAALNVPIHALTAEFGSRPSPSDVASVSSLATLRRRRGFTQQQLADSLELDVSTIQRWEKVRRAPRHQALRVAEVLGVRLIDLASLSLVPDPPKPSPSLLRNLRQQRHLPTRVVAVRVGVSVAALRSWEAGRSRPTWAHARLLGRALGVELSQIFQAAGLDPPTHLDPARWSVDDLPGILLDLRRWHGLTQCDVADRVGVCDSTVSSWEMGKQRPRRATLGRLDHVFGLHLPLALRAMSAPRLRSR